MISSYTYYNDFIKTLANVNYMITSYRKTCSLVFFVFLLMTLLPINSSILWLSFSMLLFVKARVFFFLHSTCADLHVTHVCLVCKHRMLRLHVYKIVMVHSKLLKFIKVVLLYEHPKFNQILWNYTIVWHKLLNIEINLFWMNGCDPSVSHFPASPALLKKGFRFN